MTVGRLVAIIFIFGCVLVAWIVLGTSINMRTNNNIGSLGRQVEELWGGEHVQTAPGVLLTTAANRSTRGEIDSSKIGVLLNLEHRRKGLLWYATYAVTFDGSYSFQNTLAEPVTATITFLFPSENTIYDDFDFRVDGVSANPSGDTASGLTRQLRLAPGERADIHVGYRSRGLDQWVYRFSEGITTVRDFVMTVDTDFADYDFPAQSISPTSKRTTAQGQQLVWQFENMVAGFDVGVKMPARLNPGPLASRMSYFAPVSLLFFFAVLVVLGAVRGINLHPMHYFFLGASFFAFHLLFAYLVDHIVLELAFVIAALVSLGLVISYLGRVVGWRFALREAGISQFLFLVLFSYAFFFEGYTGLVVTIGAILTLAALMHITARVDWSEVFRKKDRPTPRAAQTQPPQPDSTN